MDPLLILTLLFSCLLFSGLVVGRPPGGSSEEAKVRYRELQKAYGRTDGRHDLPDGTRRQHSGR